MPTSYVYFSTNKMTNFFIDLPKPTIDIEWIISFVGVCILKRVIFGRRSNP